jgi:hypothetical protein
MAGIFKDLNLFIKSVFILKKSFYLSFKTILVIPIYYTNTQANVSMISQNVIRQKYTPKTLSKYCCANSQKFVTQMQKPMLLQITKSL